MKKIAVIALCAVMLGGSRAYAMSEWAESEAASANKSGLVTESILWGSVTENITREEFCYLAMNLYKNMGGTVEKTEENPFVDTDNLAVIQAYSLGIINGKTEQLFYPDAPITRQEIAKIIMLTVNSLQEKTITEKDVCDICQFEDFEEVHDWATEYMEKAVKNQIINGVSKTKLLPLGNATREQALVIMNRAYESFSETLKAYKIPEIYGLESGMISGDTISFSWDKIDDANSYTVILRDRDKNVLKTQQVRDNSCELAVGELSYGKYSVIVGARVDDYAYVYSQAKNITKNSEEYVEKYPTLTDKKNRVFPNGKAFTDYNTAKVNMKTVTVPVWKLNESGEKYSDNLTVEVNANLAEDIVKIFTEIYNDNEKFPIKDVGGFSWRQTAFGSVSEHSYGTCIDINWDENYYCHASNGQAITGSFWKPYENPYSIPAEGSVVRIFKKYGFKWGGDAWTNLRDYMHFTYLGR